MAASDVSLVVIAPTQVFVSCPGCRNALDVRNEHPLDGAKLFCARCGKRLILKVAGPPTSS